MGKAPRKPDPRKQLESAYDRLYAMYESGEISPEDTDRLYDLDAQLRPGWEAQAARDEAMSQPMMYDPEVGVPGLGILPVADPLYQKARRLAEDYLPYQISNNLFGRPASQDFLDREGLLGVTGVNLATRLGDAPRNSAMGNPSQAGADLAMGTIGLLGLAPGGRAAKEAVEGGVNAVRSVVANPPSRVAEFLADESGAMRLYHGSPYDFDRFSMENIGTGQGKQAYGRGLYFAENEDVAKAFRANNSATANLKYEGAPIQDESMNSAAWWITRNKGDKDAAIREWMSGYKPSFFDTPTGKQELRAFESIDPSKITAGSMYEVDVNANPADFMDWDATMSAQPMAVQNAFAPMVTSRLDALEAAGQRGRQMAVEKGLPDFTPKSRDRLYQEMRGGDIIGAARMGQLPGEVENMLSGAGVPGIRYLDEGTVGGGKGTRNYVVFDENLINIVRKYGIAGAAAMLGVSALDVEQAMAQGQQQPQGLLSMGAQ